MVEAGEGAFRQNEDGTIVKADGGNIIWHTIYDLEKQKDYPTQIFQRKDEPKKILTNVGERIYTVRESSPDDPVYSVEGYYYYKNNENFLKHSLKLSDEAAAKYSVIIKTITPKELNANPSWAKYADLYIVSASCADNEFKNMWKKYNRYHHTSAVTDYKNGFENTDSDKERDISWEVAKEMYDKITADTNYAAIMMTAESYKITKWTKVMLSLFDWNLRPSGDTFSYDASNNNMYKLTVMLLSMKQELFKKLYLDKDNPLISNDGKFLLQTGDAQEYWNMFTFLPTNARTTDPEVNYNWYGYFTSMDKWNDYQMAGNIEENRRYINNHIYIGGDGGDILRNYLQDGLNLTDKTKTKYTDFQEFMDNADKATPADAVRYVLGMKNNTNKIEGDLNILDIEPCYDSKNGYSLTKNYIYIMLPNFDGKVNITHMTTAEFIGNSEDLNSTYNMIFMGLDDGAYNKEQQTLKDPTENKEVSGQFTKWNDSAMNGKIYFHTGDLAKSTPYREGDPRVSRSVKFLWFENNRESTTQDEDYPVIRFPGNDITKVKQKELSAFLDAGYPIVAIPYLYETNQLRIDQNSNICKFIKDEKNDKSPIYQTLDATSIESALKRAQADIEWKELPAIYNGETASESSSTIKDANYLNTDTNGRSLLTFKFTVKDTDANHKYKYRIYIDQNRDGKFEDDEIFYDARKTIALNSEQTRTLKISKLYVGLIQWKIEVYRTDNQQIRFTKTGCSVAKNRTGSKKQINVLQIMPNDGDYNGKLNLSTDSLFTKYYKNLDDYEISGWGR